MIKKIVSTIYPFKHHLLSFLFNKLLFSLSGIILVGCASHLAQPPQNLPLTAAQIAELGMLAEPPDASLAHLTPARWSQLPNWRNDDLTDVLPAFLGSCLALQKKPAWRQVCQRARQLRLPNQEQLRHFFETNFTPYLVQNETQNSLGLITGYYEPQLQGSLTQHGIYQTPLHAFPQTINVRLRNLPREKLLQQRWLKSLVLVWAANPVDAAFLQIQGSGIIELDNGQHLRLGYAGSNQQPFRSFSVVMLRQGLIAPNQATLVGIRAWAAQHPHQIESILNINPRYIYFRALPFNQQNLAFGPIGALGIPLTRQRSIAVDPRYIQLGAPVYLATTYPLSQQILTRLTFAQDTGNAIKNAVRADFFWGRGEYAEYQASKMKQKGRLWVFLPRKTSNHGY